MTAAEVTVPTAVVVLPVVAVVCASWWWAWSRLVKHVVRPWVREREERAVARALRR